MPKRARLKTTRLKTTRLKTTRLKTTGSGSGGYRTDPLHATQPLDMGKPTLIGGELIGGELIGGELIGGELLDLAVQFFALGL